MLFLHDTFCCGFLSLVNESLTIYVEVEPASSWGGCMQLKCWLMWEGFCGWSILCLIHKLSEYTQKWFNPFLPLPALPPTALFVGLLWKGLQGLFLPIPFPASPILALLCLVLFPVGGHLLFLGPWAFLDLFGAASDSERDVGLARWFLKS